MPRIISYTPSWLSRSSPGFELFNPSTSTLSSSYRSGQKQSQTQTQSGAAKTSGAEYTGPTRIIARRDTEIFVVVDNQIRWSDLCMLKDDWTEQRQQRTQGENGESKYSSEGTPDAGIENSTQQSYRILEAKFSEPIRQLSVSPSGDYLAIITSHTIYVGLLPNSSKLGQEDSRPIKLRKHQIGPTTHVLSHSPIASVLWHPCGAGGNCLLTITEDGVVRLWELHPEDRWSYDSSTLAIDLKKLALGVSEKEDFSPDKLNRNRSYSMDNIGMEVASACFGGTGSSEESPWGAMTLWIAMKEGDVYALCPLLPNKWQPASTTLPLLSAIAISKRCSMEEEPLSPEELQQCKDVYQWISELDDQEPRVLPATPHFAPSKEIYNRPLQPHIPKLQGPFRLLGEGDVDLEISDIHVIGAQIDNDELMYGEELDSDSGLGLEEDVGLSVSIVCILARAGRLYLYVDFTGVEGQWLPRREPNHISPPLDDPCLTPVEILDSLPSDSVSENEWPTFSTDPQSRYAIFVTHSQGVLFFSLEPWVRNLELELQNTANASTAFRINVLANGSGTLRERIIDFRQEQGGQASATTAAVCLQDSDLGYFLLTMLGGIPHAAELDKPNISSPNELEMTTTAILEQNVDILAHGPTRSPYVPPASLWARSMLPEFLDNSVQNRHKKALKEEIRLSSATLDLITQAHRVVSEETHTLSVAAADLFRRCERLQVELHEQIARVREVADRIDHVTGRESDARGDDNLRNQEAVERRIEDANARQEKLLTRFNEVKANFTRYRRTELSEKERAYISDVHAYESSIMEPEQDTSEKDDKHALELWQRLKQVCLKPPKTVGLANV
ncbi:MAG: hypothetical protein Q9191_002184 [Dirinaria sp. TL-2023a]